MDQNQNPYTSPLDDEENDSSANKNFLLVRKVYNSYLLLCGSVGVLLLLDLYMMCDIKFDWLPLFQIIDESPDSAGPNFAYVILDILFLLSICLLIPLVIVFLCCLIILCGIHQRWLAVVFLSKMGTIVNLISGTVFLMIFLLVGLVIHSYVIISFGIIVFSLSLIFALYLWSIVGQKSFFQEYLEYASEKNA